MKNNSLSQVLKIKKPFLMIDEVKNLKIRKSCIGYKKIKTNDWFLKSHFINEPTMPGALLVESMLQTSAYLIYKSVKLKKNERCIINSIQAKFLNKITQQGYLKILSKIIKIKQGFIKCESSVFFDKKKICFCQLLYKIPYSLSYEKKI